MQHHPGEIGEPLVDDPFPRRRSAGFGAARGDSYRVIASDRCKSYGALHARGGTTNSPPAEREAARRQHADSDTPEYAQAQYSHGDRSDGNGSHREAAERQKRTDGDVSHRQPAANHPRAVAV